MIVVLFVELSAGENRLVDVDNDDEIAAVDVRGEVNLVLAAQKLGSGDSRAAQGLAGCVENVPFLWTVSFLAIVVMSVSSVGKRMLSMIKIFDKIVRRAYNISEARQYFISHAKNSVNCFFKK